MSLVNKDAISRAAKHRLKKILRLRREKKSMEEIGLIMEISKQRVSQILAKAAKK